MLFAAFVRTLALSAVTCSGVTPATRAEGPPRARVELTSSLVSAGEQIRQRAFDGSTATAFRSQAPARAGDVLTFTFDVPVLVRSVAVLTGAADGTDRLEAGQIEVSEHGQTYESVATCDSKGSARAEFTARPLRSIRLAVTRDLSHPLVVREVTIGSDQVQPFRHPVEFSVVCTDAPELSRWTEAAARLCEQWYDTLNDALTLENTHPSERLTLTMRRDYHGVAEASSETDSIVGAVEWFATRPNDQGAIIHELVHIIQHYPGYGSAQAPGWLVEGIADYIRFFVFEPGQVGPIPPDQVRFDGSYRVTASFLDYLTRVYDPALVRKLDQALRQRTYSRNLFGQLTGKSLRALNNEWRASLGLAVAHVPISPDKGSPRGAIRGGKVGAVFDEAAQGRLCEILVRGGSWIDSITCTWTNGQEDKAGETHGGSGGDEHIIELEPGESLLQVSGVISIAMGPNQQKSQTLIGSLAFRTNRRTVGPIGLIRNGEKFLLEAPSGQEICGFRGRCGDYLNAIGIRCRPIPK